MAPTPNVRASAILTSVPGLLQTPPFETDRACAHTVSFRIFDGSQAVSRCQCIGILDVLDCQSSCQSLSVNSLPTPSFRLRPLVPPSGGAPTTGNTGNTDAPSSPASPLVRDSTDATMLGTAGTAGTEYNCSKRRIIVRIGRNKRINAVGTILVQSSFVSFVSHAGRLRHQRHQRHPHPADSLLFSLVLFCSLLFSLVGWVISGSSGKFREVPGEIRGIRDFPERKRGVLIGGRWVRYHIWAPLHPPG